MAGGGTAANILFTVCGPKCSLCCLGLSVWGVVMLVRTAMAAVAARGTARDGRGRLRCCSASEWLNGWRSCPGTIAYTATAVSLTLCVQGLLGVFFKIEAVALYEDIEESLPQCKSGACKGSLSGISYYSDDKVSEAYTNAAYSCWGAAALYCFFMILSGTFVGINWWRSKVAQS